MAQFETTRRRDNPYFGGVSFRYSAYDVERESRRWVGGSDRSTHLMGSERSENEERPVVIPGSPTVAGCSRNPDVSSRTYRARII